jgi:hypothetical protein
MQILQHVLNHLQLKKKEFESSTSSSSSSQTLKPLAKKLSSLSRKKTLSRLVTTVQLTSALLALCGLLGGSPDLKKPRILSATVMATMWDYFSRT